MTPETYPQGSVIRIGKKISLGIARVYPDRALLHAFGDEITSQNVTLVVGVPQDVHGIRVELIATEPVNAQVSRSRITVTYETGERSATQSLFDAFSR